MIDADALSRLPGLCSRVTGRHRKALNRLTLLVNGQDWVGNAPAHAYQKTTTLPLPARLIKHGLPLADIRTHLRPIQGKIDSFRCSTHTNPRAEPARVHRADQAGARPCRPCSQTMGNVAGPAQVAKAQNGQEPAAPQLAQHQPEGAWTGRTRASNKRKAPETGSLVPEAAAQRLLPKPRKSMRRRRKKRVLYPLLSRECKDVNMVEHIDWKWLDPENGERGADMDEFCKEISKIRELGTSVTFEVIRGLYNEQERAVKILGHQVVDGGAQKRKARRTLANEQGGQTQYKVQWANTIVLKEHLKILQDHGYSTSGLRPAPEFACIPASCMLDLVEASWEPTWEPEARLLEFEPHLRLVQEHRADFLIDTPSQLWAHDVDGGQPARLQQGLDAQEAPCNADHQDVKNNFHVHLDPINPDFNIVPQAAQPFSVRKWQTAMLECRQKRDTKR